MKLPYVVRDNKIFFVPLALGLIAWIVVTVGFQLSHKSQVGHPVQGTVISTEAFETEYQCGSTKAGDVTIPIYCPDTDYHTAIAVNDERAVLDFDTAAAEGAQVSFWQIFDKDGTYSYGHMDPQGGGQLALDILFGFLGGMVVMMFGFMFGMLRDW